MPSKAALLDPKAHEAKIDDQFRMKTSLDYDTEEVKFLTKNSILELVFEDTKQVIGHCEFDIGKYANRSQGQLNK